MNDRSSGGYADARIAELYDYLPSGVSREDIAFFVDEAVASGGPVLELGCGTGRVLLPIARKGIEITGLDLAEPMLDILRDKLAREPEAARKRVKLAHADMSAFDAGEQYVLAITPSRPFQHIIAVEDQLGFLRCANRHLVLGGRLILDMFHVDPRRLFDPAFLKERVDFADVALPDGRRLTRTHRCVAFHRAEQYNDIEFVYTVAHRDGRVDRVVHAFQFRYLFRYEAEHLLARCGFGVAALFGDFDRSAFADDSPQMIFVGEKHQELHGT